MKSYRARHRSRDRNGLWRDLGDRLFWLMSFVSFVFIFLCSPVALVLYCEFNIRTVLILAGMIVLLLIGVELGYHRYFSHKSFATGRVMQFILALLGCLSLQKGPLWWRSYHLVHHKYTDQPQDPHGPVTGFFHAYCLWLFKSQEDTVEIKRANSDPEIRVLDIFYYVPSALVFAGLYLSYRSGYEGALSLMAMYLFSMFFVFNVFFTVNSVGHLSMDGKAKKWIGYRNYETRDYSRNLYFLSFLSLGAGLHNNHHKYPYAATTRMKAWEVDPGYMILRLFQIFGLVWNLKLPKVREFSNEIEFRKCTD